MALASVTTTFNVHDLFGDDFDPRRAKAWATTNVDTIHDTSTGETRIGGGTATIAADGTGTFTHWAPGADGNPVTWQTTYHFDVPDSTATSRRRTESFGPFTVTTSGLLTALVVEQVATPTATASDYATAAGTSATAAASSASSAATSATAAQTAETNAETARDETQALREGIVGDLTTTDSQVATLATPGSGSQLESVLSATIVDPHDVGYDGVILAGQSNIVSQGPGIDAVLDVTADRVKQFPGSGAYVGQVISATDPLYHREQRANTVGSGPAFARKLTRAIKANRSVCLIPAGMSGTGFTTTSLGSPPAGYTTQSGGGWDPTGAQGGINLYQLMLDQIVAFLALDPKNRITCLVWCQGEADTAAMNQSQYAAKLDALIAGVRGLAGVDDDLPVVVVSMTPERIAALPAIQAVDAAHIQTQARLTRTAYVYGPAGFNIDDTLHYSAAGQRKIGNDLILPAYLRARANVLAVAPLPPVSIGLTQTTTAVAVTIGRPEGRFTDFDTEYRRNGGAWTAVASPAAKPTDIYRSITGLTLGDVLDVRVRTHNEAGVSAWTTSTLTLLTLPPQVTGLSAGTPGTTAVPLSWTAVGAATAYQVEYKLTASGTWLSGPTVTGTVATVTGLTPAAGHDFRVSATNAAGAGTPSATTAATTATPSAVLTDMGISAWRAVSMRKTVAAYSGPAIKVRRSSDSTTQDIGFTAGGDLDTTALLAFVGAGSGYLDTWYDQSGNANHFTQATTANQPRIVNAGVVETKNGRPMPWFDGTNDAMDNGTVGLYAAGATSVLSVLSLDVDTTYVDTLVAEGHLTTSQTARYGPVSFITGGAPTMGVINDANALASITAGTGSVAGGAPKQLSMRDTGTTYAFWIGGTVSKAPTAYTRSGVVTVNTVTIGAVRGRGTAGEQFIKGHIAELLLFTSSISDSARGAGEVNQKDYYAAV